MCVRRYIYCLHSIVTLSPSLSDSVSLPLPPLYLPLPRLTSSLCVKNMCVCVWGGGGGGGRMCSYRVVRARVFITTWFVSLMAKIKANRPYFPLTPPTHSKLCTSLSLQLCTSVSPQTVYFSVAPNCVLLCHSSCVLLCHLKLYTSLSLQTVYFSVAPNCVLLCRSKLCTSLSLSAGKRLLT